MSFKAHIFTVSTAFACFPDRVFLLQAGRSSKRQLFLFPGGIERHVKIKTCTVGIWLVFATCQWGECRDIPEYFVSQVALEVIEELCYEMGLHRMEAMREYAIFVVTSGGEITQSSLIPPSNTHIEESVQNQPVFGCLLFIYLFVFVLFWCSFVFLFVFCNLLRDGFKPRHWLCVTQLLSLSVQIQPVKHSDTSLMFSAAEN